ncbi:type II toxin-antitoxin system VapC family toxin [Prauserella muralis]|uniref:Ribonuclease VapC n=1 Tax=Prauserella muralis TaxID=588067 RepID=A0A2V4BB27_9PSEU|nr:type II toxin-antitoxin system VapC family toxin [Prauserella muralis]PXY26929.1 hypothetical protein BAY60_10520 [Prauserella muralis]TWE23459.1 hypothetical protein FHX69_4724 [Prauserella muralis]
MIYLHTSAFAKLVWKEPESAALREYLAARPGEGHVSSTLLAIEARRAALRAGGQALPRVDVALQRVGLVDISAAVVESASRIPEPTLRSLDAIHRATALLLETDVSVLLTYDNRLAETATAIGLAVAAPS